MNRIFRIESDRVEACNVSGIMEELEGLLTVEESQVMELIGVDVEMIANHISHTDTDFLITYDDGKEEPTARETALTTLKNYKPSKNEDWTEEDEIKLEENIESALSTQNRKVIMDFLKGNKKVQLDYNNKGYLYICCTKKYQTGILPKCFHVIFDKIPQTRKSFFEWMLYDNEIGFEA